MGQARLRALHGLGPHDRASRLDGHREHKPKPAPDPKTVRISKPITFDGEIGAAMDEALEFFNERRVEAKQPPFTWGQFVVYGLIRRGLDSFSAWKAEYESKSRLVKTPDELARERRASILAGGGHR